MTASNLKNYSDEKLIEDYNYIVQCYNDFTAKGDTEFANNMMSKIPDFETELLRRNLVITDSDIEIQQDPKPKAKPQTAPSSQAITKQAVQNFKPLKVIQRKVVHLKISSYFLPKSRFYSFQDKIRRICRHFKQFNEMKETAQIAKKEKYKEMIITLKTECINLVKLSVKEDYQDKILKEKYTVWGTKETFSLSNLDTFLNRFFK